MNAHPLIRMHHFHMKKKLAAIHNCKNQLIPRYVNY